MDTSRGNATYQKSELFCMKIDIQNEFNFGKNKIEKMILYSQ